MNDPNNAYLWKLSKGSQVLAQVLECVPHVKSQKVIHNALNGALYVQQIGMGSSQLDLTVLVENQEDLLEIDRCNAEGRVLSVYYRGTTYYGLINDEMPEAEANQPGKYYSVTMTFLVSLEVKDVIN